MNVMFTSAGRRVYLLEFFRQALEGSGEILAVDADRNAPALQHADAAFVVPRVTEPEYVDVLLDISTRHAVGMVLPLNDVELPILARRRGDFERRGIRLVVSDPDVISVCLDKYASANVCRRYGIAVPDTWLAKELLRGDATSSLTYPVVVKPRWGSASIGVTLAETELELRSLVGYVRSKVAKSVLSALGSLDPASDTVIIQEFIEGTEYGVDVINDLDGRYAATLGRQKLGMRAGETDRAMTVSDDRLLAFGERISKGLRHIGNLDCDVVDRDGTLYCIDLNPRFGGGYPFSHLAGADLPRALLAWAEGRDVNPRWLEIKPGVVGAKFDIVQVIEPGKAL